MVSFAINTREEEGATHGLPRAELAAHTAQVRAEGYPAYEVHPVGDRETYSSIIYLEPFTGRNLRAFGFDMFNEPIRRAAMERETTWMSPAFLDLFGAPF